MKLSQACWPEITPDSVLVIPLGSTEQHGPHLPLGTDTIIATELARRLVEQWPPAVLAPAIPYGSSGEHAGFPGTLSIGQSALELLLVELIRSADAFASVVVVSAHGGNAEPLARAVHTLRTEQRRVRTWSPSSRGADAHAGRWETSLMLAIAPRLVRFDAVEPGNVAPLAELMPALMLAGVRSVSGNGILGDPTDASAQEGCQLLEELVTELVSAVIDG